MTLYLIGLGLGDEKDISVKGLEIIKKCDVVYAENYTSILQTTTEKLEQFYGKKIILASREISEQGAEKIILEAQKKDVAFLVVGDPFSATTHVELYKLARERGILVKVIHNTSVLTAIGITGLQLYKFGRTTSIPFIEDHPNLETPYKILQQNRLLDMHTLFLLDLKPEEKRFMTIHDALTILESIEKRKKENIITNDLLVVGCARLGSDDFVVKVGKLSEVKKFEFGKPPHCLIIPGKMHFVEEEAVQMWTIGDKNATKR